MAGILPDSGVAASQTLNAVDVDTVNCAAELFYSVSRCQPRFDPAAMNAVLSELLNLVSCAGLDYDCSSLTNVCDAVKAMALLTTAVVGTAIQPGAMTVSTDGDVFYNCTAAALTPVTVTTVGLTALGLCPVGGSTLSDQDIAQAVIDAAAGNAVIQAQLEPVNDAFGVLQHYALAL